MGMKVGKGGNKGFRSEINVTPLVDVVLVLLIIFMVVTPVMQKGRSVDLPAATHVLPSKSPHEQLLVVVTEDGKISADDHDVTLEKLSDVIGKRIPFNPGIEVVVKGDSRLDYGTMRRVMTACREAGAKRVVLGARELRTAQKEP